MADLSLRVKADFEEASRQFRALAESSESAREKIAKFTEKFKSESVDKFIERQELAAIAVKATGRDTDAAKTQAAAYQREIERLIKSGLDPQDAALKKLQGEYSKLTTEVKLNEAAHKAQETAVRAAKAALIGIGAAIAAGAGLAIKAAAANEDMIAAFVPLMQGDTEKATALFKAIQKEAAVTPFEIDKIAASVKTLMPAFAGSAEEATKAFRMLGDTAGGNAQKLETITNAYTKSMLKGKVSMQEINMMANAGVPIYTELAKSMGVTEAKMMEMCKKGQITSADMTAAFQSMTSEGGIFFKGMETSSDTFNMRLLGIKENVGILAGAIGEKLLPVAKDIAGAVLDAVQRFTEWIQEGDNLKNMAINVGSAVAGAAAAFLAFTAAMKVYAVIQKVKAATDGLTLSVKALSVALAGNPIGLIATGAAVGIGLLTTAIVKHTAKRREHKAAMEEDTRALVQNTQAAASNAVVVGATRWLADINNAIATYESFLQRVTAGQETLRRITERDPMYVYATEEARLSAIESERAMLTNLIAQTDELKRSIDTTLALTGQKYEGGVIKDIIDPAAADNAARVMGEVESEVTRGTERIKTALELLQERLSAVALTERQSLNEQASAVAQFLQHRAELEDVAGQERIAFLESLRDQLLSDEARFAENRVAIEKAANEVIAEEHKKLADEERKLLEQRLDAHTSMFSGLSKLIETAGKENEGLVNLSKGLAIAETTINTAAAVMKAFRDLPYYLAVPASIGIAAQGVAQSVAIASTNIPSAETGGRFIVPDVSPRRVDGVGFRVNPGEEINITPRGMTGGGEIPIVINVLMDRRAFAPPINLLAREGELYNLQLAGNL